ncbi:hypothetical protein FIU87_07400 [Bacillus sp. THAF10]|uniref:DUF192 domain-containing protein n=1 Tax=Bacillus sp. THAF10 TaxID=2587848 RepID=UPI001269388E|nr:DUF192 domain-containing protein [Bacillus sp. THAF10]QFT88463.1 hypothetical protein FIU87_07400 [Bacillus sp. THAF10]
MFIEKKIILKSADTIFSRLMGLMFKKDLLDEGLLITPCNSIHMFFMRFPIDVVFLDKNNCIVLCIRHFKPWRVSPIVKNSYSVLELPIGSIDEFCLEVGKCVTLKTDGANLSIEKITS